VTALRRALARNPGSVDARRRLVRSLLALGRVAPARTELARQLRDQPGDLEARLVLADLDVRKGERRGAWRGYATVCQLAGPTADGIEAARRLVALVAGWADAPAAARGAARQVEPWLRSERGSDG